MKWNVRKEKQILEFHESKERFTDETLNIFSAVDDEQICMFIVFLMNLIHIGLSMHKLFIYLN